MKLDQKLDARKLAQIHILITYKHILWHKNSDGLEQEIKQ